MIKPNELRIGNFVLNTIDNEYVKIASLIQVMRNEFDIEVIAKDEMFYQISEYNLEYIPLTEQWLLDFGFDKTSDKDSYDYILRIGDTIIQGSWETKDVISGVQILDFSFQDKVWRYVHELQNLIFIISGEDPIIKK